MDRFDQILKDLPKKPARSRLDPYGSLIEELLGSGWTYRAVARILADKCNAHSSISTIDHFMRRRKKPKRNSSKHQRPARRAEAEGGIAAGTEGKGILTTEPKTTEDSVYQRIAALKQRPVPVQNAANAFHYDPDKPLQLPQKPKPPKTVSRILAFSGATPGFSLSMYTRALRTDYYVFIQATNPQSAPHAGFDADC